MAGIKNSFRYIGVFLAAFLILMGVLVLAAKIPQTSIRDNTLESAEYLCAGELFGYMVEDVESSKVDRYADSILLGISYQYDSEKPLESVMRSSYYFSEFQNVNDSLLEAVRDNKDGNQQYLRYWHGSISLVRPLLTVLNIRQIYVLNGVVLLLLAVWLIAILVKKRRADLAAGVLLGLVMTSCWVVPCSLEYTWSYVWMLLLSIVGVKLAEKQRWNCVGVFFMVGGMVTSYLDFLTTETLTLLVPLLLMLGIDRQNNPAPPFLTWKKAGRIMLAWGCGYAGMWLMKWLMAAWILDENVMPFIAGNVQERLSGDIGLNMAEYLWGAVYRNLRCLFPFEYGVGGIFAGIGILGIMIYHGYVYRKNAIDKSRIWLLVFLGVFPYVRYLVLHNHSFIHCFFTYRSQMATVLAAVMILGEITDWRWPGRGFIRKR